MSDLTTDNIKQSLQSRLGSRKYIDKTFWVLFMILICSSIVCYFSAASQDISMAIRQGESYYGIIFKHIGFFALGIAVAYIIQFLPSWVIRAAGYVCFAISVCCLVLTFVPGFKVGVGGVYRWVKIPGLPVFQPSEAAKPFLVIVVSDLLSRIRTEQDRKRYFWITLALTGIVCLLILPNNLSTTLLIGIVMLCLMVLARIPMKWIGSIVGIALLVLGIGYAVVYNVYVKPGKEMTGPMKRAVVWVERFDNKFKSDNPTDELIITKENYQAVMADVAVARGGKSIFGVGPGNSIQRYRLPEADKDYIFAIIVEEWGIFGAVFLILIYLAILFRACYTSSTYTDYSAMLMVMGLALMLTIQAFISMEVAVGLGPVTGQNLPLMSSGGTSTVFTCIYFGIMMAVSREQKQLKAQEQIATEESWKNVPIIKE